MKDYQLKYLKTWVMRTKSDAVVPSMEKQMMPNIIANLKELEEWLDNGCLEPMSREDKDRLKI